VRFALLAILTAWPVCHLQSQELAAYWRELQRNNPSLQAARHRVAAAQAALEIAGALPDPMAELMLAPAKSGHFAEEMEASLALRQMIPWKGKIALKVQQGQAHYAAEEAELAVMELELRRMFAELFAEYYLLGASLTITGEHLELLKTMEAVIEDRYANNGAAYHDLLRIQIELDSLKDRQINLQGMVAPLSTRLCALLGRPPTEQNGALIPFPQSLPKLKTPREHSAELLWQQAVQANPSLRSQAARLAARRTGLAMAELEKRPDFSLGLQWRFADPSAMEEDRPLMFSFGVNLPLWGKKQRALVAQAAGVAQAEESSERQLQLEVQAQLRQALFQVDEADRKWRLYGELLLPKAREALEVSEEAYRTGAASYVDLIQSENALLEFSLALREAESNHLKASAGLHAVLGQLPANPEE
jgi:outer membrane protein TolC